MFYVTVSIPRFGGRTHEEYTMVAPTMEEIQLTPLATIVKVQERE